MTVKLMLAVAAAVLVASPLAAHAATAPRVPAAMAGNNERIVGLLWQYLILPVIVAAVIALISGGDDEPVSP